jgi:cytochrome P450
MHFHAQRFVSGLENQEKLQVDAPLFRCIDESNLPPQEKSVRRLAHEAVVVIAAGSETTSKALTWSMFYILSNEHVLQKLLEEIMQIMPDASKLPSTKDIENSPYIVCLDNMQTLFKVILYSNSEP